MLVLVLVFAILVVLNLPSVKGMIGELIVNLILKFLSKHEYDIFKDLYIPNLELANKEEFSSLSPNHFETIKDARLWGMQFVKWYNNEHKHNGLKFISPTNVIGVKTMNY